MGSYLTFSPLVRERNGYFLLHYCPLSETFPLRSTMPCVARTFLSPSRDSDRTACLYILDLMILDFRFQPHKAYALTTPSNSPLYRGRIRCTVTLKRILASVSPLPVQWDAGGVAFFHSKFHITLNSKLKTSSPLLACPCILREEWQWFCE